MLKMIKVLLLTILAFGSFGCNAQNSIEGVVLSKTSNKPVGFVNIVLKFEGNFITGTNSDEQGNFILKIPININSLHIELSKVGYSTSDTTIFIKEADSREIKLFLGGVNSDSLLFDGQTAKADLLIGIVKIYHFGLPAVNSNEMNRIAKKYGFEYNFLTCEVNETLIESVKEYNEVVEKYLSKRNQKGWQEKLKKEIKAIE